MSFIQIETANSSSSTSVTSASFTVPAAADYALLITSMRGADGGATTLTGATLGGQAFTLDNSTLRRFDGFQAIECGYILAADLPSGSVTFTANRTTGTNGFNAAVIFLDGRGQAAPQQVNSGVSSSPSDPWTQGITLAANSDVIDGIAIAETGRTLTVNSGQTDRATVTSSSNLLRISSNTGTASATVNMDWNIDAYTSRLSHFILAVAEAAAPAYSITDIDGDNNVQAGQTGAVITTVGIDPASVTQTVTLGGEALTITSWADVGGNAQITVTMPEAIALKWGRADLQLAVTHDGGTTTLENVTLSAPTGWETVTFNGTVPDAGTTESFVEKAATDADLGGGGYTMQSGDILAWETQAGLTIDAQTIPTVDPAATVSGSYKIWNEVGQTWTSVSTFTINDLGLNTGEAANGIVKAIVSNIVSNMVN